MTPIPDERLKELRALCRDVTAAQAQAQAADLLDGYGARERANRFLGSAGNRALIALPELLDEIEALRKALRLIAGQPIESQSMAGIVQIARAAISPPPPPSRSAPDTETEKGAAK